MKGAITKAPNSPFEVVTDIEKPKPGADQILVKSIATAINPVDTFMISGAEVDDFPLVASWPMVLGCDASGTVVEVGKEAESIFKVGDRVCGCTRLGETGYGTFQEYFLMDARLAIPIPKGLSYEQGAGVGVGAETAALGLFNGLKLKLPDPKALPEVQDVWVFVLGGAGSVGQYAVQVGNLLVAVLLPYMTLRMHIQLAKISGYRVVATCSAKTASVIQKLGADATIDYRKSEDDQLEDLKTITGGNFFGVYDTVAKSTGFASRALKEISTSTQKRYFATTNDWSPIPHDDAFSSYQVALGMIGKSGKAIAAEPSINDDIAALIPVVAQLIADGHMKPNEIELFGTKEGGGGGGFEAVGGAVAYQQKGATGGKVVVVLQEA
ncbi:hypothetical protein MMC22_008339 [Lobaria immixta]|nr:hypothetical protein [Lobaria immixta]